MEEILNEIQQVFLTGNERLISPYLESITFEENFKLLIENLEEQ